MKKLFQRCAVTLAILSVLIFSGISYASSTLPAHYEVTAGENISFDIFPFKVSAVQSSGSLKKAMANSSKNSSKTAVLNFLNFLPVKTVEVNVVPRPRAVACGTPFGIKIHSKGVMIIGISEVEGAEKNCSPGKISGLQKGDILKKVNNTDVSTNEDLEKIIEESNGEKLDFSLVRNLSDVNVQITPVKSRQDGKYRAGIWVRDSSAGIGTLTFFNPENGCFAGLGHAICDPDTGEIVPVGRGDIVETAIADVSKGSAGLPGELKGCFTADTPLGEIHANNSAGVYGTLKNFDKNEPALEVALKQEVKKGPAQILTTIEGETAKTYAVNIDSISYNINSPTKNLKLTVTDKNLLSKTGGIVQGMSGSPIIQEGRIVGAVTHVFVNNPCKGYGIFAETMITNSNKLFEEATKKNA